MLVMNTMTHHDKVFRDAAFIHEKIWDIIKQYKSV